MNEFINISDKIDFNVDSWLEGLDYFTRTKLIHIITTIGRSGMPMIVSILYMSNDGYEQSITIYNTISNLIEDRIKYYE